MDTPTSDALLIDALEAARLDLIDALAHLRTSRERVETLLRHATAPSVAFVDANEGKRMSAEQRK